MSHLFDIIAAEIQRSEAISFERFMELALYCPDYGYYEKEADIIGRKGDFQTSVAVGGIFGELLGGRFAEWQREMDTPSERFVLLEAGAHRGDLAADILGYFARHEPELLERIEYWILEPSVRCRGRQQENLQRFGSRVRWLSELSPESVEGVIFSNELLDAIPVRRLGWDKLQGCWYEIGVALRGNRFEWARLPENFQGIPGISGEMSEALPDGFTTEVCPQAVAWWERAARALKRGFLLTLDYGLDRLQFFTPERTDGTLRSYHRHRMVVDVLAQPGEQDITAHIDFTAIRKTGENSGLETVFYDSQEVFLADVLRDIENGMISFDTWNPGRIRQFQTLTHPQHFGRAFRVLIQRR